MMQTVLMRFMLLGAMLTFNVHAAQMDDIRVVIDVSGSMVETDPNNLRVPALRMLNGLVPSGSKAGVWTFGRYVNMEVKWGVVNDKWRQLADKGADKIHSRGQYTNIESALNRASTSWKAKDSKTRRNIILLTDGKVDIAKDADKNAQSRARLLSKTIPELVKKGAKIHAIALSDSADLDLLKRLAVETTGSFEIAHSAEDLQRIFLRMFERASQPDTVPLQGNRFTIDKSIKEMTLLVFRKTARAVKLTQPDGRRYSQKNTTDNVRWRSDEGYDLITVSNPVAGEWALEADVDKDNRVMIVTDLKLVVEALPAYTTPDQDLAINVELHDNDKKISKNSFLKFVDFSLTHEQGGSSDSKPLVLKNSREIDDKGIYQQRISQPLGEGTHEVVVTADARTFNRSKRFTIEVQWPVSVEARKTAKPGQYQLIVKAREEYIKPDSLRLETKLKSPDGQLKPVAMAIDEQQWIGDIDASEQNGLHFIQIQLKGEALSGEVLEHRLTDVSVLGVKAEDIVPVAEVQTVSADADDLSIEQKDGTDLMASLIIIGGSNLLLILAGGAVYFFVRKKKKAQEDFNLIDEGEDAGDD